MTSASPGTKIGTAIPLIVQTPSSINSIVPGKVDRDLAARVHHRVDLLAAALVKRLL